MPVVPCGWQKIVSTVKGRWCFGGLLTNFPNLLQSLPDVASHQLTIDGSDNDVLIHDVIQMVQYGRLEEHPAWVMILVKVNHVLLTINSATNIVIYSYKVQQ